ncbi:MAG: YjiH family protein [Bacilli bacterium]
MMEFKNIFTFIFFSVLGLFLFFVPITINDSNTIVVDHLTTFIINFMGNGVNYYVILVIIAGIAYTIYTKSYLSNLTAKIMLVFKILGLICAIVFVTNIGPSSIMAPSMLPFLFEKLALSLSIIIPLGGMLLCFITGYGLMEFIGVFARPFMRPVFKTPGTSAIDAVASFVGSYSIGLLITNDQYENNKYTKKEAALIATGFSTVSATFMVIVAKTLDLMGMWTLYFTVTLFITFVVTAITVRLYPLSKIDNTYIDESDAVDDKIEGNLFKNAWNEGLKASSNSKPIAVNLFTSLKSGFIMGASVVPTVLSIGLLGLLLSEYTPIFDFMGYLFFPFTKLLQFSNPLLVAKASAVSIAEMFLPALLIGDTADFITRFSVGVLCVSEILFLSASIPCILSTKIPIKLKDIFVIWYIRVVLTLVLVVPVAYLIS